jgi:hypothetical protein
VDRFGSADVNLHLVPFDVVECLAEGVEVHRAGVALRATHALAVLYLRTEVVKAEREF